MKLTELKRIAEQATPGPWYTQICNTGESCWCRLVTTDPISDENDSVIAPSGSVAEKDAKHIATFHPALALELIGLIEDAKLAVQDYLSFQGTDKSRSFLEALRKWEGK